MMFTTTLLTLTLGGQSRSVELAASTEAESVQARTDVYHAAFGIEPPRIGPFWVGDRVHDELVLGAEVSRAHLRGLLDSTVSAARPDERTLAEWGGSR